MNKWLEKRFRFEDVKGTGFSPYVNTPKMNGASAPEAMLIRTCNPTKFFFANIADNSARFCYFEIAM